MDKKKREAREPAPESQARSEREQESEGESENESERERERDRRKTEANPPEQAFQKYENKPYAKIFTGSYFAKLRNKFYKNKFSENYLQKITHSARNSGNNITQNNSQGIIIVIISCQSVIRVKF